MDDADLLGLLDRVIERASRTGRYTDASRGVEAYGVDRTETTVRAYGGAVESLSSARTRGVGIRVIDDGRIGYAYTVDVSEASLERALSDAERNATVATPDEANILPQPGDADAGGRPAVLDGIYDERQEGIPAEQKVEAALQLEAAATGSGNPDVKGVDTALYGDDVATAAISSTTGVRGSYRQSDAYVMLEVIAERDGQSQAAYGIDMARYVHDLSITAAADEAVERATRLLGARKPTSQRIPVVLDPFVTASLLGVIAGPLNAEAVQRGRSLFADKVGQRIGPASLRLVDDGRHPDGPASAPWDGEGTPTQRTVVIDDGVLQGFLHNTISAARDGARSTGNASRSGYRSPPGLSPSNFYIEPGSTSPADLVRGLDTAFYCQQVMGLHSGANPISGDFSVGAAGVMISDGQFAEPVREATIAGSLPDMLAGIAAVADDLRFLPFGGGMGGLTIRIDGMTLAGT